ncbi:MAG: metallophosphoesterase family protein, partial [Solirubrobacteraceae bacterium]
GGDAVPGRFAAATLARLRGLPVAMSWVRGNGEREVAEAIGAVAADPDDPVAVAAALSAAELSEATALALGELPRTVSVDGVLYCHASPRRDDEMLTRLSSAERWSEAMVGVDVALVVGGHTHQQDDRTVDALRFVNAGSVGLPYEGTGAARWLWVSDGVPEFRTTLYDAGAAGARILDAGWPDSRSVNASLIDPIDPASVLGAACEVLLPREGIELRRKAALGGRHGYPRRRARACAGRAPRGTPATPRRSAPGRRRVR